MQRFLEAIYQNLFEILNYLTHFCFCSKGFCVIRKTFGVPYKTFNPGLCYKLPIIQTFDFVNMKR